MHARGANEIQRLLPPRLAEPVEEQILSLERAAHRRAQRRPQRFRQADEQRVGRLTTSKRGSRRSQSRSLSISFRWKPPVFGIDTVISPRLCGSRRSGASTPS